MTLSASSQNSPRRDSAAESCLLDLLRDGRARTVEELLEEATEFSWAQLFVVVDSLSRSGMIELRRDGFTYWLRKAGPWGAANVSDRHY